MLPVHRRQIRLDESRADGRHLRKKCFGDRDRPEEVGREGLPEQFDVDDLSGLARRLGQDAGIVDEHVKPAVLVSDPSRGRLIDSVSVTSRRTTLAAPPIAAAASVTSASLRTPRITIIPSSAIACAMARPRPRFPPVIRAMVKVFPVESVQRAAVSPLRYAVAAYAGHVRCGSVTSRRGTSARLQVMATNEPFEQAVHRHGATVLRVCRAALGPGADADDAWSETFLAALRAWPDLDDTTNVEAWLVRVAQRKAIDIVRGRARHADPTERLPDRPSDLGVPDSDSIALWQSVARLPTKQRLAVAYHLLGGLPHAETAELIGGNAASVRRAAADGIRSLRLAHRMTETAEGDVDARP